jgi:hypothetical protein
MLRLRRVKTPLARCSSGPQDFSNVSRDANDNGNFVPAVHRLGVPNLKNRRTRIARAFGSGTKVHSLALGESASPLRLVHGFEFDD